MNANILWVAFLNKLELICLHAVKWFQVLLSNSNNSKPKPQQSALRILELLYPCLFSSHSKIECPS